jgi:outer membrane immunogenic protein
MSKRRLNAEAGTMQHIFLRLVTATAFTVASAATVQAADIPSMVYKAPPPAPVLPSWTGFYVGAHVGAGWQHLSGGIQDPNGFLASGDLAGGSDTKAIGGLQAGYNWQFAPRWVAGVEGDFSWAPLLDHREANPALSPLGVPAGPNAITVLDAKTKWLASARARLGYTGGLDNTMFYLTGGAAWDNVEYDALFQTSPPLNQADPGNRATKSGWVVGAGTEWMATSNFLLRAEYLYYRFDSGNSLEAVAVPDSAPLPVAVNWGRQNIQVFRIAGSFKF